MAGQPVQIILVRIIVAHVHNENHVLVMIPPVPGETDHAELLHTGEGGKGVLQIIRVDVFTGFVDDDILQAAFDEDAAGVIHLCHVTGGKPAAFQSVRRKNFPFHNAAGMDSGTADLQFAGLCSVLAGNAVFSGSQLRAHGPVQAAAQAEGGFKTVDGGFRHAEAVDRVIAQGVEGAQGLGGGMASAQNDHVHLRAQHFRVNGGEKMLLGQAQTEGRRHGLDPQGNRGRGPEQPALQRLFLLHGFLQGLDQIVAHQGDNNQQIGREMAADIHDGIGGAVREVHVGGSAEGNQYHVGHEAQHMMEGQKGQGAAAAVIVPDDPPVLPVNLHRGESLFADGLTGVGKNAAAAGGAAGAHGHIFSPDRGETDGTGRIGDGFIVDLPDIPGEAAGLAGDDDLAAGLLQKTLDHTVGGRRVQQERVVAGTDDAPEEGRPVGAGIDRHSDPSARGCVFRQVSGKIVRPAGHLRKGEGPFLTILQPDG